MRNSTRMALSRRDLVAGLLLGLSAPTLTWGQAAVTFSDTPFTLGVASGDPAVDGFVIWTRLALKPLEEHGGMPSMRSVPVAYEVAEDEGFRAIVAKGETLARPELGHSVHVELAGLKPARPYWYRFTAGGQQSPVGRGRTRPVAGSALDRVRFVAAGCQNYEAGLFTAYRGVAAQDLDFVWHYGDYIYEGGPAAPTAKVVRRHVGLEIYSLDDYRRRYALYKLDPDLQAAHAAHSWWVTWDDHETDNNWAADRDQDGTPPEAFNLRRQAAAQAYYENMPLRASSLPRATAIQIYRRAAYGDLLDCHFLDTRQFRDDQPCGDNTKPACAEMDGPNRTIMGAAQERWLFDGLAKAKGRWNLIAQQVMVMPLDRRTKDEGDATWNLDSWGGYPAARKRLIAQLQRARLTNVVVTTGDEHQNYAGELRANEREGAPRAVEFVSTSISSGGDGSDLRNGADVVLRHNPQLKFINDQRGFMVHEVARDTWRADFMVLDAVTRPDGKLAKRKTLVVERGKPGLSEG